jgi:hypothetical protein
MKITEKFLLPVALHALKKEHNALRNLRRGPVYQRVYSGICDLPESALVYIIYKALLHSNEFEGVSIGLEEPYNTSPNTKKRPKYIDLTIGYPGRWDYIEFGWYTPKKVRCDYEKLLDCKEQTVNKYIALFRYRSKTQEKLDILVRRVLSNKRKWGIVRHYPPVKIIKPSYNDKYDRFKNEREPVLFEISLIKVG